MNILTHSTPYSIQIFPTLKTLCGVFDKDKKSVDILLKHNNFDEFLSRLESTVNLYFQKHKIDCGLEEWEKCVEKINKLFLDTIDCFGTDKLNRLNKRIFRSFVNLDYGVCYGDPKYRLEGCIKQLSVTQNSNENELILNTASTLQEILNELVIEAEEFNLLPDWIKERTAKVESAAIIWENSVVTNTPIPAVNLTVTPKLYSDAQLLFKKYPGISFEKDKKTICFKEVKQQKISKSENILKSIEIKKPSEDFNLIFILAKESLKLSKVGKTVLSDKTNVIQFVSPFLYKMKNELKKLNDFDVFQIKEQKKSLKNAKNIHQLWNLNKLKQEAFFDFCIEQLGKSIKENGKTFMCFTNMIDRKGTIPGYPGSIKILNKNSNKIFFNDMLKENSQLKDRLLSEEHKQILDNAQKNLLNLKEITEQMVAAYVDFGKDLQTLLIKSETNSENVHNEELSSNQIIKEERIEIVEEAEIEIPNKKETFVKKTKKAEDCVKKTLKILKKPKPTDVHLIVSPGLLQMAMKSRPKAISTGNLFPGEAFPYKKDPRVLRWEVIDFDKALTVEDFPDHNYCILPEGAQKWAKIIHHPNEYIDNFAHMGLNELWYSKNEEHPCISVLAEISYMNRSYRGVMQWTFNKSQTHLYHKCFKHEFDDNDPLKKKLKEFDYPRLSQHEEKIQYGSTLVITRDNGTVTLIDKKRDVTVQLLKA